MYVNACSKFGHGFRQDSNLVHPTVKNLETNEPRKSGNPASLHALGCSIDYPLKHKVALFFSHTHSPNAAQPHTHTPHFGVGIFSLRIEENFDRVWRLFNINARHRASFLAGSSNKIHVALCLPRLTTLQPRSIALEHSDPCDFPCGKAEAPPGFLLINNAPRDDRLRDKIQLNEFKLYSDWKLNWERESEMVSFLWGMRSKKERVF